MIPDINSMRTVLYGNPVQHVAINDTPTPVLNKNRMQTMQVCIPPDFTDQQSVDLATAIRAGTWSVRMAGDDRLLGTDERVPCNKWAGCLHLMLDSQG